MKTIARLFREVKLEIVKIAFLNSFLNTCIVFFALYLGMILVDINYTWALLLSLLFFLGDFYYYTKKLNFKSVEDANPVVREMLRTAHDNQN